MSFSSSRAFPAACTDFACACIFAALNRISGGVR
jgi:hypothetical protein